MPVPARQLPRGAARLPRALGRRGAATRLRLCGGGRAHGGVMPMARSEIETLDAATSTLTLSLDVGLYPRDVLYAAAYVFLDRAYVLLDRDGARFLMHLRGKQPLDEVTLRAMAGEFENELLAQALRHKVVKANQKIIEQI